MRSRAWTLAAVGIATFMSALDGSVVNTVLPLLREQLHTTVAGVEWVTTMYLLVVSAILLGVGRAGDLYGHKRLYIAGFVIFVIGSALCGASGTIHLLVAFRALQALGASMLFANAPAILTKTFPPEQRGRALGAQGTFTYLGLTVGPSLGGWLATQFGWRSVFYINVPVCALAIFLSLRFIEDDRPEHEPERFDFSGALLFTIGLVALLTALNQGHAWGWSSANVIALIALSIAALATFVIVERRRRTPMLDLTLFGNRTFSAATAAAVFNYMCVYSVLFVVPFVLIQALGLDAQHAGLVLTAQPIIMAVVAPFSGTLSDRIGSKWLATTGMLLLGGGVLMLALLLPSKSRSTIALSLAVVGLGVGIFVSPNNSALMGAAPRHRQGIAAGVLASARNVGMVLGVGVAGAVFTTIAGKASAIPDLIVHGAQASLFVTSALAAVGTLIVLVAE